MAAPMRAILRVETARQGDVDNLLANFERELRGVVSSAQAILTAQFTDSIAKEGALTRGNVVLTSRLPRMWERALERAGLQALIESFVDEFDGQIPYFEEILALLNERVKTPLPALNWTNADMEMLAARKVATLRQLDSVMTSIGHSTLRRVMTSIGGADPSELAVVIATQTNKSIGQARTVADTSLSTFYRTVQDAGYRHIEAGLQNGVLKYEYFGPDDKLTRPFCVKLIRPHVITKQRRHLTREQIDELDNGQTEDVFLTGGGFGCRHSWLIAEVL